MTAGAPDAVAPAPWPRASAQGAGSGRGAVVLLHGLGRHRVSMTVMGLALERAGFEVHNVGYPSQRHGVAGLAAGYVAPAVERLVERHGSPVSFVTHSLGGILVRELARTGREAHIGRVVMLAPPNRGSELVDWLRMIPAYRYLNGPAGIELGTDADSVPNRLGPARFEVGVIAGRRSRNPLLSAFIRGADDGKVSVERTRLEGMRDFTVVDATHTFIMNSPDTIARTVRFLRQGSFGDGSEAARPGAAPTRSWPWAAYTLASCTRLSAFRAPR